MRLTFLSALALSATIVTALPASGSHSVHEKRSSGSAWSSTDGLKPDGRTKLPVRIGLSMKNLDMGDEMLMKVSDPMSSSYGKHWSPEEVLATLSAF